MLETTGMYTATEPQEFTRCIDAGDTRSAPLEPSSAGAYPDIWVSHCGNSAPQSLGREPPVKQHLTDFVLVIACALGLFLATTWVRGLQEAPVLEQIVQIVRQRGFIIPNGDRAPFDQGTEPHAAERPE
jgi:hypothetical protein